MTVLQGTLMTGDIDDSVAGTLMTGDIDDSVAGDIDDRGH